MSNVSLAEQIKQWQQDAEHLSYEEALVALDLLLSELQNDAVPMAELQQHYRRGEIYLDHCEALLNTLEQSVVELDPDTLEPNDDA